MEHKEAKKNTYTVSNLIRLQDELTFIGQETETTFEFTKNFPGFDYLGVKIPQSRRGSKIKLNLFIAQHLAEKGYGDVKPEYIINVNIIKNYLEQEKSRTALIELPPNFIELCLQTLTQPDTRYREAMIKDLKLLMKKRQSKLMRKIGVLTDREIKRNLSDTEKILLNEINTVLNNWSSIFDLNNEG